MVIEILIRMADQQHSSSDHKQISLNKIIDAMTTKLENNVGAYVQFQISNQQTQSCNWNEYTTNRIEHCMVNNMANIEHPIVSNIQPINSIASPLHVQDMSQYDSSTIDPVYLPSQTVNHLEINENNDLIGTIDVGGGNYINIIYGNTSEIMENKCQVHNATSYNNNQSILDQEYGLFNNQQSSQMSAVRNSTIQNTSKKQLIDNLVGNWVPNQTGTYSPFGGSSNIIPTPLLIDEVKEVKELPQNLNEIQQKKRKIAEIKPMRPSYSDVLTKCIPTLSSPCATTSFKPKHESATTKVVGKTPKSKHKSVVLKRQNSSGSDDHSSSKLQGFKKTSGKTNLNLSRRCVSLDNLEIATESSDLSFNRSDTLERKKSFKISKKNEKGEILNNSKIQNNSMKNTVNCVKHSIQINNNLSTKSSYNQSISADKIEKNQQINNKVKEDKKLTKDKKSSKYIQMEKAQQIRKGQRNRKREHRDIAVKDVYKTVHKYFNRWNKMGLQIVFWLLHLISDVISMSVNLVIQLGKYSWHYIVLHLKYLWFYILSTCSKISFLNTIGNYIDSWFGNSQFAFWQKLRKKRNKKDESTSWMHGRLESNIALPSTGEEAMKRLLAYKGKDPYSILGVSPTCTDDDIKKYYKRQAFLVHPDKNNQPGAEEAFKILVHAFDIIGEPERRQEFDQSRQVEVAWDELSDLLSKLHRKMEQAANTIRCTNCGMRHKRIPTQRPCYAARFCSQCKIRHSAREGDIWAESRIMGFLWHYYACMDGAVYDITDWAACQVNNLKQLQANTHTVQYRIVLGQRPASHNLNNNKKRGSDSNVSSKAEFEDFLSNLYSHCQAGTSNVATDFNTVKSDNRRRKVKRKK